MNDEPEWDYAHQQAETIWTVRDLIDRDVVSRAAPIELELHFNPGPDPDPEGLKRKLRAFGYAVEPSMEDDAEKGAMVVTVPDVPFDEDSIWQHEERTTKIALIHGFRPDGWGFFAP